MGLIFDAFFLYALTTIFGEYNDTATRWKAFFIVIAGGVVQAVCIFKYPAQIGPIGTLLLSTSTVALLLVFWCRIAWLAAAKITAIFLAVRIVIGLVIRSLASQTT